jgi:hypothetical protein
LGYLSEFGDDMKTALAEIERLTSELADFENRLASVQGDLNTALDMYAEARFQTAAVAEIGARLKVWLVMTAAALDAMPGLDAYYQGKRDFIPHVLAEIERLTSQQEAGDDGH